MAHITFGRNEEDDYFNPSSYGVNSGTRTEGEAVCSRLSGGLNGYDSTLQTERTERVNTLSHILQGHQTAAFSSGPMCPLPAADPSLHVDFQMSDFERSLNQPDHPELPSGKQMLLARADVMVMEGSSLFETPRPRAATVPPQVENSGRSSTLPELELSFSGTFGGLPTESVVQTYKHVANLHRLQRVERDVEDNRCNAEPGPVVTAARAQDAFQRVINHAQAVQGGDGVYRFPRWGAPKEAQKLAAGSKYPVELRSFGAEGLSGLMTVTNVVGYPLRVLGDAIASGASGVCTVFDVKTQCAAAQHSVASALHTVGDYVIPDRLVELGRSTVVSFEDMGIARGHTQATGGDLLNIGLVLVGGGVTKQVTKMGRTGATGNGVALAAPPLVEESGAVTLFTATDKIKLAARTHQRAVSAEVVRAKTQVGQALMPKNLPQTFGEFFSKAGRVQLEKVYVQGGFVSGQVPILQTSQQRAIVYVGGRASFHRFGGNYESLVTKSSGEIRHIPMVDGTLTALERLAHQKGLKQIEILYRPQYIRMLEAIDHSGRSHLVKGVNHFSTGSTTFRRGDEIRRITYRIPRQPK